MHAFLKKLGLNDKEARVYLTTLQLGEARASRIAKNAGLNRSTTYVLLEKLRAKHFIREYKQGSVAAFIAISPEELSTLLERRKKNVELQLEKLRAYRDELEALRPKFSSVPRVRQYEGEKALGVVYEALQDEVVWSTLFNPAPVFELFAKQYSTIVVSDRISKGTVREIMPDTIISREIQRRYMSDKRHIRLLKDSNVFESNVFILKNKVFFITFVGKRFYVLEIEDKPIVQGQQLLFDSLWQSLG